MLKIKGNTGRFGTMETWSGLLLCMMGYVSQALAKLLGVIAVAFVAGGSFVSSAQAASNIFASALASQFVYVANGSSNDVSVYSINSTTGALIPVICNPGVGVTCSASIAANFAAGTNPGSVSVSPSGKFAYVANQNSNNISIYNINPDGSLTAGVPVSAGTWPISVNVEPTGKFAYVANLGSNNISMYSINQTTGALTEIAPPVSAGTNPYSVVVDPTGKFAYVANPTSNNISVYKIDQTPGSTYGALFPVETVPAGIHPSSIAVDPTGTVAYVANNGSNNPAPGGDIFVYSIDPTYGRLTHKQTVVAGSYPYNIKVDPTRKFVYVANDYSNNVSAYKINPDGTLLASTGVSTGTNPQQIAVDMTGKFAYVASSYGNIFVYSIDQISGALTQVGAPVPAGINPFSITSTSTSTVTTGGMSPIVFIPGIMGSKLFDTNFPGGLINDVWPDFRSLTDVYGNKYAFTDIRLVSGINLFPNRYDLIPKGGLLDKFPLHSPVVPDEEVYGNWIAALKQQQEQNGLRWLAVPYDWRQPLESPYGLSQVKRVKDSIEALYKGKKVLVVAHSLGSLLAKSLASDKDLANKIEGIVFVAAPQLGAPDGLSTLLHGSHELTKHSILIPDINQANLRYVVSNMPGAFVLAPSLGWFNSLASLPFTYPQILSFKVASSSDSTPCSNSRMPTLPDDYKYLCSTYNNQFGVGDAQASYKKYLSFLTDTLKRSITSVPDARYLNNIDNRISLPAILNKELFLKKNEALHNYFDDPQQWNPNALKIYQLVGVNRKTICGIKYELSSTPNCILQQSTTAGSTPPSLQSCTWVSVNEIKETAVYCPTAGYQGDGTVPFNSAQATLTAETYYVDLSPSSTIYLNPTCGTGVSAFSEISHGSIMAAKSLQEKIFAIASGSQRQKFNSDCPLGNAIIPKGGSYIVVTIYSPVYFSAVDAAGKMTGNYPDGIVKEEIIGSRFTALGESKSIVLDANQPYRLEMIGFENGVAGFTAELFDEYGKKYEETAYRGIPVVKGMKISENFSTAKELNVLPVDINGDGVVDQTINPILCNPVSSCVVGIPIEINPFKKNRAIEIEHEEEIKIAIISTYYFDASHDVDRTSLTFGHFGNERTLVLNEEGNESSCKEKDVNKDGVMDLICEFRVEYTGLVVSDVEAILHGKKLDGSEFEGRSPVVIIKDEQEATRKQPKIIR